ncbi:MAG: ferrous iron transport protein A [Lentisphaeria bacterium]|nr:ferrous iron transport protein A [Lentisphaeria bacterium]
MTPLTEAQFGQIVTIVKVAGDLKDRQHLADLGCVLNAQVTVVNQLDGDLILKIKGARVALGEALAKEIYF